MVNPAEAIKNQLTRHSIVYFDCEKQAWAVLRHL